MARPTISDVAHLAGVSIKTVSRLTNGDDEVAVRTAERVRAAIAGVCDSSNPLARSLRTGHDEAVGLAVESIADPFFASVTDAIEEALRDAGLFLIIICSGKTTDEERTVVLGLLHRSVCGLIIVPCKLGHGTARLPIGPDGVPVVFIDRPSRLDTDAVIINNEEIAREATAHLVANGHHRVAFAGTDIGDSPVDRGFTGYLRALAYDPTLQVSHHRSMSDDELILVEAVTLDDSKATMLSANALTSSTAVCELHRAGRTNVALPSFDDFPSLIPSPHRSRLHARTRSRCAVGVPVSPPTHRRVLDV